MVRLLLISPWLLLFSPLGVWTFAPPVAIARPRTELHAGVELGDSLIPVTLYVAAVAASITAPQLFDKLEENDTMKEIQTKTDEVQEKVNEIVKQVDAQAVELQQEMKEKIEVQEEKMEEVVEQVKAEIAQVVEEEPKEEEETVEVVVVEEEVVPEPPTPKPVAVTVTPKTISQVKREVASTLDGELEKEERLRLAAARRAIEHEDLEETTVAGATEEDDDANVASEEQQKKSTRLRRKLFKVLKKSVAPWRKWENIS